MRTVYLPIVVLLVLFALGLSQTLDSASCIGVNTDPLCLRFVSPKPQTIATGTVCTLGVEACKEIRSVEFKVCYRSSDHHSDTVVSLGTITRAPFKMVWDTKDIPAQLFSGVRLLAVGTKSDRSTVSAHAGGVFISNSSDRALPISVPFGPWMSRGSSQSTLTLEKVKNSSAVVTTLWNGKELRVIAEARNPFFRSQKSPNQQGVELLFSKDRARHYPSGEDLCIRVNLDGKTRRVLFQPDFGPDGAFSISSSETDFEAYTRVQSSETEGFEIEIGIPIDSLRGMRGDSVVANVVVHIVDDSADLATLSWAPGVGNDIYSPVLWGNLLFLPRPYYGNPAILWPISFLGGFLLTLLMGTLVSKQKRKGSSERFEQSEEERRLFAQISASVDTMVTNKSITLAAIAGNLSMQPRAINSILSKFAGLPFRDYLMKGRVELAKERLRSSHSSLSFIADSCGFRNVGEMEKYFKKVSKTTPYRYRKEFHVT